MKYLYTLLVLFVAVLIWSGIGPKEYFTWILEVFPAIIGAIILMATYKSFRFTYLVYTCIFIHASLYMHVFYV